MFRVGRGFWLFLALAAVGLIGVLQTKALIYYRILFLSLGIILLCVFLALISLRGVSIKRKARITRHLVGQVFEENYLLSNDSVFGKLWLEVRDLSSLVGENGSKILSGVRRKDHRSYIAYSLLNRRGLIPLGPTRVMGGDPLGMFQKSIELPPTADLMVFPYFTRLKYFPLKPGILAGGNTMRQKTYEITPYAAGVREYVPSDSLNRIHWPSTARRGRLMVKEFDQDPQSDVWIFLDSQESVQSRMEEEIPLEKIDRFWIWHEQKISKIPPETYEYGISMAASIANYALEHNHAVGMATAGQISTILPAERGSRQFIKVLELLANIESLGKQPLSALVETQTPFFQKGSTVVLITPTDDVDTVRNCVDELILRRMNPVMILIDANSFGAWKDYDPVRQVLKSRGVPLKEIKRGDDLADV